MEKQTQNPFIEIIKEQTRRALWETRNLIDCVPDRLWDKKYCGMPCWKHIYHMLHSLDLWYINPREEEFQEPDIHEKDLNNLDVISSKSLTREELLHYLTCISGKLQAYLSAFTGDAVSELLAYPSGCEYCRFTLILAQFRHWHTHLGMIMGFMIDDTGQWPRVLGLENPFPEGDYSKFF